MNTLYNIFEMKGIIIMKKIALLIPCYNEEVTIKKVIRDFKNELPDLDIYVYDNNSKDSTAKLAAEEGAIVRHEYNQGKGNVVRRMFREVEADIYVMVDGDDTYPANEVHKLIAPIISGEADMVIGDRLSNGTYKKENKRKFHEFGNNLVKKSINRLFKANLKDIMTGYRAFSKMFVKNMPVLSEKFEIETEMTLHALDKRFIIKEIPIEYRDRPSGSVSKLNTIKDGIKVLKTIVKMYKDYKPMRFYLCFAIISALLGIGVGIPVIMEYIKYKYVYKVPSAILATGLITLSIIIGQCGVILDTVEKQHRENYEFSLINYKKEENNKM